MTEKQERAMTPAVSERLAEVQRRYPKVPRNRREKGQLPGWVHLAIGMHHAQGMPWREVAAKLGKSKDVLQDYVASPAAKEFRGKVKEVLDDPVQVARIMLQANAAGWAAEGLLLYESAKKAENWSEAGKQWRSIAEGVGILDVKAPTTGSAIVQINIGEGASFTTETPHGSAGRHAMVVEVDGVRQCQLPDGRLVPETFDLSTIDDAEWENMERDQKDR